VYPEFTLQLCSSRRLCKVFKAVYFGSLTAVRTTSYTVWTPNCPKHHPSGRRKLSIRTFHCVEKLRTASACIRSDVSAVRPDDTQCSTSYEISFQNTDMGRSLQPSGRCGFLSGCNHPYGKYCIQNPHVRTPVFMVRTRELLIWKLRAYDQPSGRPFSWSERAKP
jgi:hypothetical protein